MLGGRAGVFAAVRYQKKQREKEKEIDNWVSQEMQRKRDSLDSEKPREYNRHVKERVGQTGVELSDLNIGKRISQASSNNGYNKANQN